MRFTKSHEWIDLKDTYGIVGITDFAQKELGDIVFVELPQAGKEVEAGEQIAVLESTKAAADVYAPVSGKIQAVNEEAKKNPSLINKMAESEGWLYKIEVKDPGEVEKLLNKEQYHKLLS